MEVAARKTFDLLPPAPSDSVYSARKDSDWHLNAKSPQIYDGGALREGEEVNIWKRNYIGLVVQYASVGMVVGTLPGTVYPFLFNYLNMEGTQVMSATVLLSMPWSFKVFFGMLTDCVPIFGYRRRPFMVIGWSLCFIMLVAMACMDAGDPYYPDEKYAKMDPHSVPPEIVATFNESAHHVGGKFIVMMMVAAFGYIAADVAADAMMVEVAQREPEATRGYTQTTIYMVRTAFVMVSNILTGFAFNGKDYGGDFDFSLSFPQLMLVLSIYCFPVIPISWYCIKEERHPGMIFRDYIAELWHLVQMRPMYQVIAYKFLAGIFEKFSVTCLDPMQAYWAEVTPMNEKIMTIVGNGVFAITLYFTGKYGLQWSWRKMHAITIVSVVIMEFTVTMVTTWDIVRNQWFWLGVPVAEALPNGIAFVIATFVMVELAGEGNEGAVYGLVGSASNIAVPLASTFTKNVDSNFDVTNTDIVDDSKHVRWEVTYVLLIRYAMNLAALLFLPLLPRQKADTQQLKHFGGSSRFMGTLTLTYFVVSLCWTTMVNILSIYPTTSCLWIAGGPGCNASNRDSH
ncbi:Paxillin 1 [Phytophthora cinnamomi]|uniref:Paxillin 1 n=1 Tax=Phytophthora cinnamomi TaxID=4785 RepID=UPI00355ABFA5|nr:Paxillin 1 [Phytophthora cinnamomi]